MPYLPNRSTNSSNYGEDARIIFSVFSLNFLFLGVLGNTAVIIYNIFLNKDKTPSSRLITHLAFADLLVCLAFYLTKIVKILNEHILCKIRRTTLYFSLFLSMMILLSITIDRYLYIAKPLKYPLFVRPQRVSILLGSIWLAALAQLPPIYIYMSTKENGKREKCRFPKFVLWLNIILHLFPICVIIILNYKMFKIVKDQRQRMASEVVLQDLQPDKVQSERLQPQQEQAESAQIQSEQLQLEQSQQVQLDQRKLEPQLQLEQVQFEQISSEQTGSEQVQSEQLQSERVQSKQVQSGQVQSEQVQSEQIQSEQVQSEQLQSDQVQPEQIQSEQLHSEQVQPEQIQSGQVQSKQNATWLRNLAVELKAMKTFAIIVGVLTFTYVPYIVMNMIRISDCRRSCLPHITHRIVYTLVGINSVANPFIYALRHKKYIRAYRKVFSAAWARLFSQNN